MSLHELLNFFESIDESAYKYPLGLLVGNLYLLVGNLYDMDKILPDCGTNNYPI